MNGNPTGWYSSMMVISSYIIYINHKFTIFFGCFPGAPWVSRRRVSRPLRAVASECHDLVHWRSWGGALVERWLAGWVGPAGLGWFGWVSFTMFYLYIMRLLGCLIG